MLGVKPPKQCVRHALEKSTLSYHNDHTHILISATNILTINVHIPFIYFVLCIQCNYAYNTHL